MHGNSWIGFFLRLPPELRDGLILSLSTGMEIIAQGFVRVDQEFLILKGRLAGTQDQGRIVVLPYSQLVYCAFARKLTDEETALVFSEPLAPVVFQSAAPATPPEPRVMTPEIRPEPVTSEPPVLRGPAPVVTMVIPPGNLSRANATVILAPNKEGSAANSPAPEEPAPAKPNLPSKAELLERLRTQLGEVGKK